MPTIQDFIIFFSLISISTHSSFVLANTTPIHQFRNIIRGFKSDHEALLAVKAEISDDPDSVFTSWNSSLHFCKWRGVTCGRRHKRVLVLDLSSSKLDGTLSPFIGNLSFLHELNLNNNSFRGEIPNQISHFLRLRTLSLSMNFFGGEIPANLSRCSQLIGLNLRSNTLTGIIPAELAFLPNLVDYGLGGNKLTGRLQDIGIGNMSQSLQVISLYDNLLQGSIPNDVGKLKGLWFFDIGYNNIVGTIQPSLFNLSNLQSLFLSNNYQLQGRLPEDLGIRLPQIQFLEIWNMSLVGQFPASLSNLSNLQSIDISFNSFTGSFSLNGNNHPYLSYLGLEFSYPLGLGGDMSFFDTLRNCTSLTDLYLGGNSFLGTLFPHSILNLSTSLQWLSLDNNHFSGQLPSSLAKFTNLYGLFLNNNHFTGLIPPDIALLESVEDLVLDYNNFTGEIPSSLGNLTLLSELSMTNNYFDGPLPKDLGNLKFLQILSLSSNKFSGAVPAELFGASNLIHLEIDHNQLQGSLPAEISKLKILVWFDASHNQFSGEIPSALSDCTCLTTLKMSRNSFVGSIPKSLSSLKSIQNLDLSYNNLSGQIPGYFSTWPNLSSLNLSFNNLNGEVAVNGVFANATDVSVVGNSKLCGGVLQLNLPKCPSQRVSKRRRLSLALIVIISIACVLFVVLSVALCSYILFSSKKRKNTPSGLLDIESLLEVSYQDLSRATKGFSPSNLIGAGGFGSVYKGILHQDDKDLVVAVKVMNLQNEGAGKSFVAECNAFRNIRHRNLVKIITVCSSIDTQRNDFKALVYEFMSRGSLDDWLYPKKHAGDNQSCSLSLFQRLSITIDIACALEYLHNGCANPMIHCDLKPTNILLDDEMTARVGDFGLAKFLSGAITSGQLSSTQVRGTVGYAAPEYGLGSNVSVEGDVYSFGIVVLEMMTVKKPTDPMFSDGLNLHDFAKSALSSGVMEIIDQRMLDDIDAMPEKVGDDIREIECIKSMIMIGVQCSLESPRERMSIKAVVNELKSTRQKLTNGIHI